MIIEDTAAQTFWNYIKAEAMELAEELAMDTSGDLDPFTLGIVMGEKLRPYLGLFDDEIDEFLSGVKESLEQDV